MQGLIMLRINLDYIGDQIGKLAIWVHTGFYIN